LGDKFIAVLGDSNEDVLFPALPPASGDEGEFAGLLSSLTVYVTF
jgi:hypothetical protein